ncbi:MAG: carbon storage regulator CsrA [Spirochaetota bacterium]
MLILARKVNESIIIGDQIVLSVVDIKGDQVKLGIQAPRNVKVYRQEVYEAIQEENRAAAMSAKTELPVIDIFKNKNQDKQDRKSSD